MPDFQAKTRAEMRGEADPQPGDKVPMADINHLRPLGSSEFRPRAWEYCHPTHSLADFRRPNFFSADPLSTTAARDHLANGDVIHYTLGGGQKSPSSWERGVVVEANAVHNTTLPIILAGLIEYPPATIWDGEKSTKAA